MEWQPISSAPKGVSIIGLRSPGDGYEPAFVGQVYDMRPNALIDRWRGKWVVCTHWLPLPPPPYATKADSDGDDGA